MSETHDLVQRYWDEWPDGSFLAGLHNQDAKDLLACGELRRHGLGETLIRQGDPGREVILLLDATVKVFTEQEMGRRVLHAIRSSGDIVGELAFLDREPRSATVVTGRRDGVAVHVPDDRLDAFVRARPHVGTELGACASIKLRAQVRRRADGPSYPVDVRLARALVDLAGRHGGTIEGGLVLDVGMTQEELGTYINTSRNRVSGALKKLRDEGIITTNREIIVVRNMRLLRARARL